MMIVDNTCSCRHWTKNTIQRSFFAAKSRNEQVTHASWAPVHGLRKAILQNPTSFSPPPNCGLRVTGTPVPRNSPQLYVCSYKPVNFADDSCPCHLLVKFLVKCVEVEGRMIITKEGEKTQKLTTHSFEVVRMQMMLFWLEILDWC